MTPEKHYNAAENQLDTIRLAVNSCELKERGDAFETLTLYCRKIPPVIPYFDSNVGRKWRLFHRTMPQDLDSELFEVNPCMICGKRHKHSEVCGKELPERDALESLQFLMSRPIGYRLEKAANMGFFTDRDEKK